MSPKKKKQVSVQELLDFLKIPYEVVSDGEELRHECFECYHHNTKMYVHAVDPGMGLYNCKHCGAQGNLNHWIRGILETVVKGAESSSYWSSRSLSDETIDKQHLRYYAPLERYMIPYYDSEGEIVNIAFRASLSNQEPKYLRLPHFDSVYYVMPGEDNEPTYIVEGEINALSVKQTLPNSTVIGLPGAGVIRERLLQFVPAKSAQIYALVDNDKAGSDAVKKLRGLIPNIITLKLDEDPNDLLMRGQLDKMLQTVPTEPPVLDERQSITAPVYLQLPDEVGDWLIEDLWLDRALGFVAGIPKSMKSMLTLHLAFHVAQGLPFLTKKVHKQGVVLLVQEEDNDHIIRKRLSVYQGQVGPNLRIWTPGITNAHIRLDTESGIELLDAEVQRIQPVLVILDPLANMHSLENENDAASMNRMLENLRHLRDLRKCSVMVVHHLRKEGAGDSGSFGQRMRGSSVLHAKSETALYMDRMGQTDLIRIRVETKSFPSRTLDIRFKDQAFVLEEEYGPGVTDGEVSD